MNNKVLTAVIAVLGVVALVLAGTLFMVLSKQQEAAPPAAVLSPDRNQPVAVPPVVQKKPETTAQSGESPVSAIPAQSAPTVNLNVPNPANPTMGMGPLSNKTPSVANVEQQQKQARLREVLTRFQSLTVGGKQPDLDALDKLIGELVEVNGSPIVAGVDFNALRENLRVAQRLQEIGKEMQIESVKAQPDKEKILSLTREAQSLQGSLRTDFMAGGMGVPFTPPVTTPVVPQGQE